MTDNLYKLIIILRHVYFHFHARTKGSIIFCMQHVSSISCFNNSSSLCLILCSQVTVPQTATHEIKYF